MIKFQIFSQDHGSHSLSTDDEDLPITQSVHQAIQLNHSSLWRQSSFYLSQLQHLALGKNNGLAHIYLG